MKEGGRKQIEILDVFIDDVTIEGAVYRVCEWLDGARGEAGGDRYFIATPNPEFIMRAGKDREFLKTLNSADLAVPDGTGIIWAGKILGTPFSERVAGVDLMMKLCERGEKENWKIALSGAGGNVANKTLECLKKKFPKLDVFVWEAGEVGEDGKAIDGVVIDKILASGKSAEICFVALGMGKQEKFIKRYIDILPARGFMGVGGSFDYVAGIVPRAPKWMRTLGFEWLYRLIRQPLRFKRQVEVWKFGVMVLMTRVKRLLKYASR